MAKIENYTVLDIINLYRKIIGNDIEKILYTIFPVENSDDNDFKFKVDVKSKGMEELDEATYLRNRANIAYEELMNRLRLDLRSNNNANTKQVLVSEIYRRFSDRMNDKEEKIAKDIILQEKPYALYCYTSDKYKGLKEYMIITKEKQEKSKSIRNKNFRDIIEDSLDNTVFLDEIPNVMKKEYGYDVYGIILEKIYIKLFLDKNIKNVKEFKEDLVNGKLDDLIDEEPKLKIEFTEMLKEYFFNNLQYIDKEALLLNAVARVILGLKLYKGEEINEVELNTQEENASEKISIDFLRIVNEELEKQNYNASYTIFSESGKEVICVNKDYLEQFLSSCTKDSYITDSEIKQIHSDILEGYLTEDIEKRKIAQIDIQDLINASESYDSKEEQEDKERILNCAREIEEYLKQVEKITDRQLLDMYLNGDVNYELVSSIDMNEFNEKDYASELKNLYIGMVYCANTDKEKVAFERLSKFSKLYKKLKENGKINIEQDEIAGEIIEIFDIKNAPEILSDLYGLEIVGLETAIDWGGPQIFYEEYKKGRLKPQEVRNFYEEDKDKNFIEIANMISNLPDNGEKFMVIGSIFPEETEEDREARDLLIDECLKISNGIQNSNYGKTRKEGEGKSNEYYKHITDPFARISLIKALDKDYSFEMTTDGHAIVKLPNFGKVIIEKMLDKNREPSYGAATYILDEKYYEDNDFRIKKDGKVNRQEIIKDINSKKVTRVIHSVKTWGTDMKEYFLQTKKIQWSKDEENEIDGAIERVKRSDPIIKDNKKLAKMILNLVVTRKATIEQIKQIADIYGVDLDKVMNSLEER